MSSTEFTKHLDAHRTVIGAALGRDFDGPLHNITPSEAVDVAEKLRGALGIIEGHVARSMTRTIGRSPLSSAQFSSNMNGSGTSRDPQFEVIG